MVVSFSGIDGAGKTTQINLLIDYCKKKHINYVYKWSKARGTPGIMFLKELVRRDKKMDQEEKLEHREAVFKSNWKRNLLFIGSMLDLCWYWGIYFRIIKRKYELVILDRYIWDTYVEVSREFQIDKLDKKILWRFVHLVALVPDRQILLTIPAEESLRRDILKEEITTDGLSFKEAKLCSYDKLKNKGCWNVELDAMKSIEETHEMILAELSFAVRSV